MYSGYLQITNRHLFIWIGIMCLLSYGVQMQMEEEVEDRYVQRYMSFFAVLIFVPIILMAVWGPPRSDTYLYLESFHSLPANIRDGWLLAVSSKSPGFTMFGVLIKCLFGSSDTAYRFIIAMVHTVPLITVLRRYSDDYLFSIYLFIASSIHLSWMMNGLRQFMAVTIVFLTTPWIVEKKYIRVFAFILLAATFHNTVLFMLPVVLIVQGEAWNWKTILFIAVSVVAALTFIQNIGMFNDIAEVTGYSIEGALRSGDDGANPFRVIVSAIPMVIAFAFREKLREEGSQVINICVNMSVITTGVFLIAMVTSGIMVGRMPIYTSLYNLILLPHVIDTCFEGNNANVVKMLAIVLYFFYFFFQRGM